MENQQTNIITIGGKINLGNYSAMDLEVSFGFQTKVGDDPSPMAIQLIGTARSVLAETVCEIMETGKSQDAKEIIASKVPKYLKTTIAVNPFAVWLLSSEAAPSLDAQEGE